MRTRAHKSLRVNWRRLNHLEAGAQFVILESEQTIFLERHSSSRASRPSLYTHALYANIN